MCGRHNLRKVRFIAVTGAKWGLFGLVTSPRNVWMPDTELGLLRVDMFPGSVQCFC